jgi:hypothetical protein
MKPEDKIRIIKGEVFSEGRWVPIWKKLERERQRHEKIKAGYVLHQGEWITIDEKVARVSPHAALADSGPVNITINRNDNRIVNYVDNKTTHSHDHRHVHVDKELLSEASQHRLSDGHSDSMREISTEKRRAQELSDRTGKRPIDYGKKIDGMLNPPDNDSQSER